MPAARAPTQRDALADLLQFRAAGSCRGSGLLTAAERLPRCGTGGAAEPAAAGCAASGAGAADCDPAGAVFASPAVRAGTRGLPVAGLATAAGVAT